jgi:hypothetical protein
MAFLPAVTEVIDINTVTFAAWSQSQYFFRNRFRDKLLKMLYIDHKAGTTIRSFMLKEIVVLTRTVVFKKGGADRLYCEIIDELLSCQARLAAITLLHDFISHYDILGIGFILL